MNRSRTYQLITGDQVGTDRDIAPAVAHHYFPNYDPPSLAALPTRFPPRPQKPDLGPWTEEELRLAIRAQKNRSPGPDGVTNKSIKACTTVWPVLLALLNTVRATAVMPRTWHESRTTFIGKANTVPDGKTPSFYRPLSLQNTTYKLFAHLVRQAITPAVDAFLSPLQKGFRSGVDGCHIQNFLLRCMHAGSLRNDPQATLYLALLDIRNAYGSIPHTHLLFALSRACLPPNLLNCLATVYSDHYTTCNTVPQTVCRVRRGILQGDPLSPTLSNLYFLPLLECLSVHNGYEIPCGVRITGLAYADDLVLASNSDEGLRGALEQIGNCATDLALHHAKSHVLVTRKAKAYTTQSLFCLQGGSLTFAAETSVYRYLGCPYDAQLTSLSPAYLKTQLLTAIAALQCSGLKRHQVLDATRTFVQSRIVFALRETPMSGADLDALNVALRRTVRWAIGSLYFPTEILHLPVKKGGTGVWDVVLVYHVASVVGACTLLNSPCLLTRVAARHAALAAGVHEPLDLSGASATHFRKRAANQWARVKYAILYLHDKLVQCSLHFPHGDWRECIDEQVNLRFLNVLRDCCSPTLQHDLLVAIHETVAITYAASSVGARFREFVMSPPPNLDCAP